MNRDFEESKVMHEMSSLSAHSDADIESRGMPRRFNWAKDSTDAYAQRKDDLPPHAKYVLMRHALNNVVRIGVPPNVMVEITACLRLLEGLI